MGEQGRLDVTFCNANYGEVCPAVGNLPRLSARAEGIVSMSKVR